VSQRDERFIGKVALITGAALGIGRGIALELARGGADVVINERTHIDLAQQTAGEIEQLGRRALVWPADVADRAAIERMFAGVVAHFGHLDIAVANAAISIREPTITAKWENVLRTIEVCQFGVYHTCQLAAQQMVKQGVGSGRSAGKLIVTGSVLAEVPFPTSAPYNMAKAAINHFVRTLASELAEHHINVNCVNPGYIDTPGERAFASEAEIQAGAQRIPWGRLGQPEDIGRAVAFLCSDEADYITGTSLKVDGGYTLGLR
jgi:glucose 1-dehydrogenase